MRPAAVERYGAKLKEEIEYVSKLGEGTYGDVYDGVRKHDMDAVWREGIDPSVLPHGFGTAGERVAVKIVKAHRDGDVPVLTSVSTLREIKLLRELHHPNLVFLEQVILNPGPQSPMLALIFERGAFGAPDRAAAPLTPRCSRLRPAPPHPPRARPPQRLHHQERHVPDAARRQLPARELGRPS